MWPGFFFRRKPVVRPHQPSLAETIDAGLSARRAERLARPAYSEAKRFARAAPKVQQLRHEHAMQHVAF